MLDLNIIAYIQVLDYRQKYIVKQNKTYKKIYFFDNYSHKTYLI